MATTTRDVRAGMLALCAAVFMAASLHGGDADPAGAAPSGADEFKVKREELFEFAQKPALTRQGDKITIAFETKGLCDVTVAVENDQGKILRHLASGVLGPNAPEPFEKNARKQTLVWDGKDDAGAYVDNKDAVTVRVSLGLKPQLEKSLFWSPHKRLTCGKAIDADALRFCAAPGGVYVSDGTGVDSVRLFDHEGNYVRTIYPFSADRVRQVKGLNLIELPQGGGPVPLGAGMMHATLLTSGRSAVGDDKYGYAAQFIASFGDRIALGFWKLNRLATDGTSGGLPLEGPAIRQEVRIGPEDMWSGGKNKMAGPCSAAFSPDGKWLYLGGYGWCGILGRAQEWLNGVTRMEFGSDRPPQPFVGSLKQGDYGTGNGQFKWAVSVAADAQGRVYVADHLNNRIQVFTPDGKPVKAIPVERPAFVGVHHKTGEIVVLSFRLGSDDLNLSPPLKAAKYTRFGTLDAPKVLATCPLDVLRGYDTGRGGSSRLEGGGMQYVAALDSWAEPPTLWLSPGKGEAPLLLTEKDGKLAVKRDFAKDIVRTVVRSVPPIIQRQRLYVNPANGKLYVGEGDSGVMKSFMQLVEIDPDSGKVKLLDLPFAAEDICIDLAGLFYLRTDLLVGRFDPVNWREVPWDYGEERQGVSFGDSDGYAGMRIKPAANLLSALPLPATGRPGHWHLGGMGISPRGHLAMTCYNTATKSRVVDSTRPAGTPEGDAKRGMQSNAGAQKYTPALYPGRMVGWETHIWDKHGRLIREDATPGVTVSDGIGIDNDDNLYVMASPNRILDGKPYPVRTAETLLKIKPGKGRLLSRDARVAVPLEKAGQPDRPHDLAGNYLAAGWAENVEWIYGGVGLNNMACICWNARPALDLFARSFAPEINHFSVAVLDSNGNLILRLGRYGNVDDGKPLVADEGPPNSRSIGGDEVALAYAAYLATHSDRRLFIADAGNSRIASVKLGYHAEERVPLKDVKDLRMP